MKYVIRICGSNPRNNLELSSKTKREAVETAKRYTGDVDIEILNSDGNVIAFKNGDGKNLHWM